MKGSKLILGLGVAMLIAIVASPVSAQCPVSREFGGQGNGTLTGRIIIDTGTNGFPNDGNELGSIWDMNSGSAGFSAGPHFGGGGDSCPLASWYLTGGMFLGTNAGIQGFVGTAGCFAIQCPAPGDNERVATLVEDSNGGNAGFILYSVTPTPAAIRYYDHARTAGIAGVPNASATQIFQTYPFVDVSASSGPPPDTTTTNAYVDLALNFHGADTTASATTGIVSYDIVAHHGASDPGRMRSAWNLGTIKSIPYGGAGVVGDMVAVPCPDSINDTFLAVGATFVDPSTGGVQSLMVGRSVTVECDPNIANPDGPSLQRPTRPTRRAVGGR